MGERVARIILLVEDRNQENLLRHYLHRLDHSNHCIRVVRPVSGKGSGEQFVRESYASEVRAIRRQSTRTKACLIAMIDGDVELLDHRQKQLAGALANAKEVARSSDDPILILIPKRNIETWILCLNGLSVDEDTDYSNDRDAMRLR